MINYTGSKESIICPFCASTGECRHLFAIYNSTQNTLAGGFLLTNAVKFFNLIEEFFDTPMTNHVLNQKSFFTENTKLADIWENLITDQMGIDKNEGVNGRLDRSLVYKLLLDLSGIIPVKGVQEINPLKVEYFDIYYFNELDMLVEIIYTKLEHLLAPKLNDQQMLSHFMQKLNQGNEFKDLYDETKTWWLNRY